MQQLDLIADRLDSLPDAIKQAQEKALEEAGAAVLERVRVGIGGSGRIAGVQAVHMGSKGGYIAVRAKAKTDVVNRGKKQTRYPAGYVTNALEHGHNVRGGSSRVAGKYMYAGAVATAAEQARSLQQRVLQTAQDHLNGD